MSSTPTFFLPVSGISPSFSNSTLILPMVSLSHVPQLTCDLLLENLGFEKVGNVSSRWSVPVAGAAGENGGIMGAIEVFQTKDRNLTIIQLHSPILKSQKQSYLTALHSFISSQSFSKILILASVDAASRRDGELSSGHLIYRLPVHTSPGFLPTSIPLLKPVSLQAEQQPDIPFLPSSGLARPLLYHLVSNPLPSAKVDTLLVYTSEGDSRETVDEFIKVLVAGLEIGGASIGKWKEPKSWERGLWGKERDEGGVYIS